MHAESFFLERSVRDDVEHMSRAVCPHCSTYLGRKTFLSHKRLYYDCTTGQWLKRSKQVSDNDWDLDVVWSTDREDQAIREDKISHPNPPPPIEDFICRELYTFLTTSY